MPLLALGTYTIETTDSCKPFVQTGRVRFTYYPLRTGLWVLGIVVAIGLAFYLYRCRWSRRLFLFLWRFTTSSRILLYVPAAAGLLCLILGLLNDSATVVFLGLPLQSVTAILLAWRRGKPRTALSAFLFAWAASAVAVISNLLLMGFISGWLNARILLTLGLLAAAVLALYLLLIRLSIQERLTAFRLLGGLLLSLGAAFVAAVLLAGLGEVSLREAAPLVLGCWALAALPFVVLFSPSWEKEPSPPSK